MTATNNLYPDFESRWQALIARDPKAAKCFLYCVKSTGIYCRPTCAARLARKKNVIFYDTIGEAEEAGFRPCKRCKPMLPLHESHHSIIRETCKLLDNSPNGAPHLKVLAENVGFTQWHFHRIFRKFTGITPRMYWEARHSPNKQIKQKLSNVDLNELIAKISQLDENTVIDHDLIKSSYSRSNSMVKPRPIVAKPDSKVVSEEAISWDSAQSSLPSPTSELDFSLNTNSTGFLHGSLDEEDEKFLSNLDVLNEQGLSNYHRFLDPSQDVQNVLPDTEEFQFQENTSLPPALESAFHGLNSFFSDFHTEPIGAVNDYYPSSTSPASSEDAFSESLTTGSQFEEFDNLEMGQDFLTKEMNDTSAAEYALAMSSYQDMDKLQFLPDLLQLPQF